MQCPVCSNSKLVMTERQGVEIDYCPDCRGVWLDRGELDKIIERSADDAPAATPARDTEGRSVEGGSAKRKRKGMLSELFDF